MSSDSNNNNDANDITTATNNDNTNIQQQQKNIVIAGGGIIGTSVAYYLVKDHYCSTNSKTDADTVDDAYTTFPTITLIDPTGKVGSCASGKAGGFLARDWRDGTLLQDLQRCGFDLHQQLADEFAAFGTVDGTDDGSSTRSTSHPTDYRRLTCAAVAVDEVGDNESDNENNNNYESDGPTTTIQQRQRKPNKPPSKKLVDLEWVDPDVVLWGVNNNDNSNDDDKNYNYDEDETGGGAVVPMGDQETIAQVHPRKLCETMWKHIESSTAATSNSGGGGGGGHESDNENYNDDYDLKKQQQQITVQLVKGRIVRAITSDKCNTNTNNDNDNDDDEKTTTTARTMTMTGVELEDGSILPADVLVIACGPWTYEANKWFANSSSSSSKDVDDDTNDGNKNGDNSDDDARANFPSNSNCNILPEITAIKCHSILVPSTNKNANAITNTQAVFFDSNGAIGAEGDLEVYPRPDGDSYVNGFANPEGVCLETPGQEVVEQDKIELLRSAMEFVETNTNNNSSNSTSTCTRRDHTQQVCYWPETPDGLPIIGKLPNMGGAYVAAGHSVWGILQGPATGKALAELIVEGRSECIDLAPFGLERFYDEF